MQTGIRKAEKMTLDDEDDNPVEITVMSLIFPGKPPVTHFQSKRTACGRKIKPLGTGSYETDAGTILRVLPRSG